jgi:4-amino-4-deoxy-L-arabinose transferase-like glycosyltransferase
LDVEKLRGDRLKFPSRIPFFMLTMGAFVFLTLPRMAQKGMFLDGVTYAVIARNMAMGLGDVWNPYYTETVYPRFTEHPPLGIALESLAFKVLGDHLYVERLFSFLVGSVTACLIVALWRRVQPSYRDGWMALLFWLLPSTVTWGITNNLLETIQTAWTTAAVLAFVGSMQASRTGGSVAFAMVGSCSVAAAVLTKGPVGFFPLAVAPIGVVVGLTSWRRASVTVVCGCAGVALIAAAIWMHPPAQQLLSDYYREQLSATFAGTRGRDPWTGLFRHFWGGILLRMGLVTGLLLLVGRLAGIKASPSGFPPAAVLFLLLGFAGSLPVTLSPRVMGHYLIPSIPMYALAFGAIVAHFLDPERNRWLEWRNLRLTMASLGTAMLIVGTAAPLAGWSYESRRDEHQIEDYGLFVGRLQPDTTVGSCPDAKEAWGIHAYLMRFFRTSISFEGNAASGQFLQIVDSCEPPAGCEPAASGRTVILHSCRSRR